MRLVVDEGRYAVVRLGPHTARPAWARGRFTSVTRTPRELSIVCDFARLPAKRPARMRVEGPFVLLSVDGELPFDAVGVLRSLAGPLADAGVPVLTISTFDTDHLLIAEQRLDAARAALTAVDFTIR